MTKTMTMPMATVNVEFVALTFVFVLNFGFLSELNLIEPNDRKKVAELLILLLFLRWVTD